MKNWVWRNQKKETTTVSKEPTKPAGKDDNKKQEKTNTTEIITNESYNMIHEIKKFLISRTYPYESNGKKKILVIESTNIPDVFNVYESNEKIGIAHVPNIKTSIFCKEN